MKQTPTPTLYCDDGTEKVLPFKWEICFGCEGHGKSSAYLGAYTRSELAEQGQEFIEDYFAGRYDRACDECRGAGKVKVADFEKMTKAERRKYRKQQDEIAETYRIQRQEMLFEGGWREEGWYGRD